MADAMGVTKKIFPTHNSPAQLADLTPVKLIELHVDSKDHRGIILKAIKTAGYVAPPGSKKGSKRKAGDVEDDGNDRAASSSSSARTKTSNKTSTPSKRPRRKEPSPALPDPDSTPPDERESVVPGGFNFDEILDEGPFGYIQRSFRQTTPAVLGAMRLLAHSYSAKELNELGYSLYCDFRPESLGWGKKAEMTMEKILALRKGNNADSTSASASTAVVTATTSTKAEE
ncbi:hypothetical protein FRC05_000975 [Tulasnella sp. 425]|nr:hypothetical protein FRC05_000975 [Tulasnella sp. 425]